MGVTSQLAAPTKDALQKGKFTLHRIVRSEASVAAPVTPTEMSYIQSLTLSEPSFDEVDIFHQGGGDESTKDKTNYEWTGSVSILKGKGGDFLKDIRGITWDTGNDTAIPLRVDNDNPVLHWEAICRKSDNSTHLFSLVLQDLKFDDPGFDNPMDYSDLTVNFRTKHMPLMIAPGSELVYDEWNGDGSTTDFTLSSTPLDLATASNYEDLVLDNAIFVKVKASGATTGVRQTSGISLASTTLTFTTAPAVSTVIQALYVKAS